MYRSEFKRTIFVHFDHSSIYKYKIKNQTKISETVYIYDKNEHPENYSWTNQVQ